MLKTKNNKEELEEDGKDVISLADLQMAAAANTPEPLRTIGLFGDLDEEKVEDICSGLLYLKHTANVNTDFPLGMPERKKAKSHQNQNQSQLHFTSLLGVVMLLECLAFMILCELYVKVCHRNFWFRQGYVRRCSFVGSRNKRST